MAQVPGSTLNTEMSSLPVDVGQQIFQIKATFDFSSTVSKAFDPRLVFQKYMVPGYIFGGGEGWSILGHLGIGT